MDRESAELRLSYILSIFIAIASLLWYIISDIFSMAKLTLYSGILNRILIEISIVCAFILVLTFFFIYLLLEGLKFTDDDYLKSLSKNSNKFYTLGFLLNLIILPFAIVFSLYKVIDNVVIRTLLIIAILLYYFWFLWPFRKSHKISENFKNFFLFIVLYVCSFLLIFGIFQFTTSDISIKFDKPYYLPNDYTIITIDQSGISYPHINEIKINGIPVKPNNLYTSDEGIKQVIIYNISDAKDILVFTDNYKIMMLDVNYSVPFLWDNINSNKFASFIVINKSNVTLQ